ncbi:MAG: AMP-binding protein [Bdellovibrionales bacterium]|jgi:long-chain acyl-CoA synthetase|nr:AMP-binding protein [Bdellovibrionales bacterium]
MGKSGTGTSGTQAFWTARYPKGIPATIEASVEQYHSLVEVFDEMVGRFPTNPAFTCMGKTLTFSELNRKAESFAAFLQNELKMKKGDRIAIQMPNVLQYPVVLFGALKAGLVIVNTNPLYTDREMKHQFNDAGCTAIVILANFACNLQKIVHETKIQHVIVTEIGDLLGFPKSLVVNSVVKHVKKMVPTFSLPDAIPFNSALERGAALTCTRVPAELDEVAFLQYTGGTTGVSKGAMLTHRNIIANMEQIRAWMLPRLVEGEEIAVCALPLYHIFSFTVNALAIAKYGGHNILITNPRDIPAFLKELKKYRVTVFTGVNTLYNALMNHPEFSKLDFSSLKVAVAGAMALQKAVAERWKSMTNSLIVEGYGLTETSPVASCNPIDGTDRTGTIGLPLPSTLIKMIDSDGNEVPLGEPGELCIKGPQVMKGYWLRPDETNNVMTADGWFKSGDVGVMDADGFSRIVDRKKDMILVSGFNVYPNEIEDVIASHPGVLEVAAIGIPDERSGEVVKVFIVKKDPSLTSEQVIEHARKNLTAYKVPKAVEFRNELPKTNVGKILRRSLRETQA